VSVVSRERVSVRSRSLALPDGQAVRFVVDEFGDETVLFDRGSVTRSVEGYEVPFGVFVPYTVRRQATVDGAPLNATWVDVSVSPVAYYAALLDWWSRGETFMVVEHDVVCSEAIVREMDECPEPWCLFSYSDLCHPECREAWHNHLGCTRFRSELVEAVPDAVRGAPREDWDWHTACNGLGENLRRAGFSHHWHGSVPHCHEPLVAA
jgi:hypothetical protein